MHATSFGPRAMSQPQLLRISRNRCVEGATSFAVQNTGPRRCRLHTNATWRPRSALDDYVAREARPISLRQLMVFGRSLTESRLLDSANYVRTELPTRIAHRIRDLQQLPYAVVTNPHISEVYNLYYTAFDQFRKIKKVHTLDENDKLCECISENLSAHLTVIPKLTMGMLECSDLIDPKKLDEFMNTILRSRISRRVIAEQHISLTDTFNSTHFSPGAKLTESDFIGAVFVKCVAKDVVERCGKAVQSIAHATYGPDTPVPKINVRGHLDASFPYILSHLEFIIGELLRNSVHAVIERQVRLKLTTPPPPIEVTICESQQHILVRISDLGGGIPPEDLPFLWSFNKGPRNKTHLRNLARVPKMAATMQELHANVHDELARADLRTPTRYATTAPGVAAHPPQAPSGSLSSLASRPPDLRLGLGLPLSKVYAEYWAGKLAIESLYGYGVDAFLQISRLGNKNEQLTTRASIDAV